MAKRKDERREPFDTVEAAQAYANQHGMTVREHVSSQGGHRLNVVDRAGKAETLKVRASDG